MLPPGSDGPGSFRFPERVLGVGELNRLAREALEARFPLLWVGGEISNLTRAPSGHLYFTLKDAQAQVRCTMWRNRAQLPGASSSPPPPPVTRSADRSAAR